MNQIFLVDKVKAFYYRRKHLKALKKMFKRSGIVLHTEDEVFCIRNMTYDYKRK